MTDENTEDEAELIPMEEISLSLKSNLVDIFITEKDLESAPVVNVFADQNDNVVTIHMPFFLDWDTENYTDELVFSENQIHSQLKPQEARRLLSQVQDAVDEIGTPSLQDISTEDTREIGEQIKTLEVGDEVRTTNNHIDRYVEGTVIEKTNELSGEEHYEAIIKTEEGVKFELHVNWRDIPEDDDDQETPYTGLLEEPFNDTAPAVTYLEVL